MWFFSSWMFTLHSLTIDTALHFPCLDLEVTTSSSQRNSNKKTNYMVNNPHKVFKPRMPLWPSKRALTVPISWVENCHQFCLELFYAFFLFVKIKTLWLQNNLFIFAISCDPVKSKEIWDPAKSCKLWISPHICLFKWHFAEKNLGWY